MSAASKNEMTRLTLANTICTPHADLLDGSALRASYCFFFVHLLIGVILTMNLLLMLTQLNREEIMCCGEKGFIKVVVANTV